MVSYDYNIDLLISLLKGIKWKWKASDTSCAISFSKYLLILHASYEWRETNGLHIIANLQALKTFS